MPQFPSLPETAHLTDLLSRFPKTVRPLMAYTNAVLRSEGALSMADRELIAAFVSGLNACTFCFGSHLIYARALGVEEGVVEAMIRDPGIADPKWQPLLVYLKKLNTLPSQMVQADAQAVFEAGWSEEALFEAIEVASLFNMMNRIVEGAGVNFDYADAPEAHTVTPGDEAALKDSYLRYGDKVAGIAQG
jgi:uncharacterized peroxidase-related enzyme